MALAAQHRQSHYFTAVKWQAAIAFSAVAASFLHFAVMKDEPLLAAIFIGGFPLLFQIALKIIKGDFGTHLLGAISVVTSLLLGEYPAGTLIILMLSGGQALESYAMRRASFALQALASRMPSTAHRRIGNSTENIAASTIQIGDFLEVHLHETCPVYGTVTEGYGAMDEVLLQPI